MLFAFARTFCKIPEYHYILEKDKELTNNNENEAANSYEYKVKIHVKYIVNIHVTFSLKNDYTC